MDHLFNTYSILCVFSLLVSILLPDMTNRKTKQQPSIQKKAIFILSYTSWLGVDGTDVIFDPKIYFTMHLL